MLTSPDASPDTAGVEEKTGAPENRLFPLGLDEDGAILKMDFAAGSLKPKSCVVDGSDATKTSLMEEHDQTEKL